MPYSDSVEAGSGDDDRSASSSTPQIMAVEMTGMVSEPFRDEVDDDDEDEDDPIHAEYRHPYQFPPPLTTPPPRPKRSSSWCVRLVLLVAVAAIVVGVLMSHTRAQQSTSSTSPAAATDDEGALTSSNVDDDDAVLDEHEEEIEEAEEALAEEEETVPEEGNNENDNNDSQFSLGSSQWFELKTGNDRIDSAYQLAMQELNDNIVDVAPGGEHTDPYFIAGHGWAQLWTRDTSYAIELAAGLVRPDVSLTSILKCTEMVTLEEETKSKETVWYQDECGHFGGWPNLSDAIVGARGAWYLYVYTGNTTFLEWAFTTTVNSLKRAEQDVKRRGLFHGCSSFMESNSGYPSKYKLNGELVGKTRALSTNMLYWNGYQLASRMGEILMADSTVVARLANQAEKLKTEIRNRLWLEDKGYYAYFEDEHDELVEHMEGLGEALVLLSEDFEESSHRIRSILDHTHRTEIGIPCLWPRFEHGGDLDAPSLHDDNNISERYHNGRIWPFVSGYFAIAAAQKGRTDIFAQEMVRLIDLSEQENTFAEFYELDKTFPNKRKRQLWSNTGYLGMIYQGLFGMVFEPNGIVFAPSKPYLSKYGFKEMNNRISLLNVKYRQAVLDIHVKGFGNRVESFSINGEKKQIPKLDATAKGMQVIDIVISDN